MRSGSATMCKDNKSTCVCVCVCVGEGGTHIKGHVHFQGPGCYCEGPYKGGDTARVSRVKGQQGQYTCWITGRHQKAQILYVRVLGIPIMGKQGQVYLTGSPLIAWLVALLPSISRSLQSLVCV